MVAWEWECKRAGGIFLWWWNVLKLDCGDGCTIANFTKNHWIVHLAQANFICRLYLNTALYKQTNKCPRNQTEKVPIGKWASIKIVSVNNAKTSNDFKSINNETKKQN